MGMSLFIIDEVGNEYPSNSFKGSLVGIKETHRYVINSMVIDASSFERLELFDDFAYRPTHVDSFDAFITTLKYNRSLWAKLSAIMQEDKKWYIGFSQ